MDEVRKLKLHIRILYGIIAAVIVWTVVLALLPPKSHYRDVALADITIEYKEYENSDPYRTGHYYTSYSTAIIFKVEVVNLTVAFSIDGESYFKEHGDIKKGYTIYIPTGDDGQFGKGKRTVYDIILTGKVNTHLE